MFAVQNLRIPRFPFDGARTTEGDGAMGAAGGSFEVAALAERRENIVGERERCFARRNATQFVDDAKSWCETCPVRRSGSMKMNHGSLSVL